MKKEKSYYEKLKIENVCMCVYVYVNVCVSVPYQSVKSV